MSLWSNTDAEVSRPKFINLSNYPAGTQLIFVDESEAGNPVNQSKGIKGPGWHLYREYTDSDGQTRYKSELVVAMSIPAVVSGDSADDTTVPDVAVVITIGTQPSNQSTVAGGATFTVAATISPTGTLAYQWQRKVGTSAWANVTGATSESLVLTGQTVSNTGDQYRVVVSGSGAKTVRSNTATLTFVS